MIPHIYNRTNRLCYKWKTAYELGKNQIYNREKNNICTREKFAYGVLHNFQVIIEYVIEKIATAIEIISYRE